MDKKKLESYICAYLKNRPLFFSFIRPQEAFLFNKFRKHIKPPVLDFGCGDGFFADITFGKEKVDVGIDLDSNPRIKEAAKNKIYKQVIGYDGSRLPFPANSFNTVVSNCVFEHIPDIGAALREINRVLKPGGKLIATVMTDNWDANLVGAKLLGRFYASLLRKMQKHYSLMSYEAWQQEFTGNGFGIADCRGYLSKNASSKLEIFHYLSVDSLFTYWITRKWRLFPLPDFVGRKISGIAAKDIAVADKNASAQFFILKKTDVGIRKSAR